MSRTFCALIRDPQADAILIPYGEVMARGRHWAFKQLHALGRPLNDVKRDAIARFGLTSRQFNGVSFDIDQAVNAWRGTLKFRIGDLKERIDATVARIARLARQAKDAKTENRRDSALFRQRGKKHRLDVLKGRLSVAEAELAAGRPRICFGGRDLLRRGEVDGWRMKRHTRIFVAGSKDEEAGNQTIQWDGSSLRLKLPASPRGSSVSLSGVAFRYGQDEVLAAMSAGITVSWLIFQDEDGRWHAHATIDPPPAILVTTRTDGVIGVDLNADHLAATFVDRCGNPLGRMTLPFPPSGTDFDRASAIIGESVKVLCLLARHGGFGLACEDLEFSKKKAALREYGAAHARRLSGFAYKRFFEVLSSRASREGIDLVRVNPAFTSVIGRVKYAGPMAFTVHHAAALVIGRRAMGYGERLVRCDGTSLDGPARNRRRDNWGRWKGAPWRAWRPDGVRAPSRTTRSASGRTRAGGPRALAPIGGRGRPAPSVPGGAHAAGAGCHPGCCWPGGRGGAYQPWLIRLIREVPTAWTMR